MTQKISDIESVVKQILEDPYHYANRVSVNKLADILRKLSYHYYNTDESLVPDEIYDVLHNILEERDPTNILLTEEIGAPISKDKVQLPYFMPSLNKIKPATDAINTWEKKYKGPYVLSDKLDGVSGLLVRKGKRLKLYTRGDGSKGQNITHLIPYVLPKLKLTDIPDGVAIRGELIISKKNFKKIEKDYANARNTVAGLVNSKNYSIKIAKLTDFITYSVINPRYKYTEQMKLLESWKLDVVNYMVKKDISNEMLSKYLIKRREEGLYEVDGIVVVDSSRVYKIIDKKPDYGFAFKTVLTDQVAEVTVLDVEWAASKHGYLKPRVRIDPVKLVGVTITYATAFNAKYVYDNNLGPGSVIKLVRSGDVIPHIMEILKPSATGKPKMPTIPYKWTKSGVDILVKDVHGAAQDNIRIKQITSFFKVLDVKYISEGIVTKLVDNGYNTIMKILISDVDELVEIDGIGEKLLVKIFNNIDNAFKTTNLERLMAASNIFGRGFGVRRSKLIVKAYPDILTKKWDKKTLRDKVMIIEGFDDITATQFANGFHKFIKFFEELSKIVNIKHLKTPKKVITKKTKIFEGEKVVFTGFRDKDLEKIVENDGGNVTGTVTSNTTLVVYVQPPGKPISSKLKKAKELKIKLMTREDFVKSIENR